MRALILAVFLAPIPLLSAPISRSDEPPAADASTADSASPTAAADTRKELVLPPGFKPKKRGKFILYCRKETVLGTRMPAEHCYDEQGIRAMLRAQLEDREKVDQMRRICGSLDACGAR